MTYQTPRSFLAGLKVGVAEDSRTKCKFSGKTIASGEPTVVFTVGGAKGEKPTSQLCSLKAVSGFLGNIAGTAGIKLNAQKVTGFKSLPRDLQDTASKLLSA